MGEDGGTRDPLTTETVAALVMIRAKMFPHGVPWWTDVCDCAVVAGRALLELGSCALMVYAGTSTLGR